MEKRFGVSQKNAERLMITELTRVQTEAQKQSYIENGYEEYIYIACGKADVCSHCSTAAHMDDTSYQEWINRYKEYGLDFKSWKQLKEQEKSDKIQLEESEMRALMEYKSFGSYIINDALRRYKDMENLPDQEQKFVKQLDSALSKMMNYEGDLKRKRI